MKVGFFIFLNRSCAKDPAGFRRTRPTFVEIDDIICGSTAKFGVRTLPSSRQDRSCGRTGFFGSDPAPEHLDVIRLRWQTAGNNERGKKTKLINNNKQTKKMKCRAKDMWNGGGHQRLSLWIQNAAALFMVSLAWKIEISAEEEEEEVVAESGRRRRTE